MNSRIKTAAAVSAAILALWAGAFSASAVENESADVENNEIIVNDSQVNPVLESTGDVEINAVNFPDSTFRQYVSDNFDTDKNDSLSQMEINAVTSIDVSGTKSNPNTIADFTGIEHFTKLTMLNCGNNQLTSLDVSKNTDLTKLLCYGNQLTSLDVSKNSSLTTLNCGYYDSSTGYSYVNQLTSLDISKNTELKSLYCYGNLISSLDVSKNTLLEILECGNNKLSSLDVSKNKIITQLHCSFNQLTSLDISQNISLTTLNCYGNRLTSLDVSKNTSLTYLSCGNNPLSNLDVSQNVALKNLNCSNNQLTYLDLSKNTDLGRLDFESYDWCSYPNQLTSLDISNTKVSIYYISYYHNIYPIGKVIGSYSLSNLPGNFDPSKATEWQGAEYDESTNSLKNFTSNTVTYKYACGNDITITFTLKVSEYTNSAGLLTFDNKIKVFGTEQEYSSGDAVPYSTEIWIGMGIDDYVNNKVLINGVETELTDNGSGYWYNTYYTINSNVDVQVIPEEWPAERLSKYVTLNADENVLVWYYNPYTELIEWYERPIPNGGYIGKEKQVCIRIPFSAYPNKPYVYINDVLVDCYALDDDGMWQIWAYDVTDNSNELRITVIDANCDITFPENKIIVYYADENENVAVCKNGDILPLGTEIWPGIDIDDYVNNKVIINGEEIELKCTGDSFWYNNCYIVNSDVDIQVVPEKWSDERMSKYVTLNADENVTVWFYNSYLGQISEYDRPIKNGGYIGKDDQICLRIPSSVYNEKPYVYINDVLVDCSLNNDGMWQIWGYDVPDNSNTLRISVTASPATKVDPPSFAVKGVFGGRNVTFNCNTPGATIYYTTEGRSTLKLTDPHVAPGETVLFTAYYGTVYARAYCDGKWSNPARLVLKIPKVNTPTITKLSNGKYKIKTTTPGTIVYYTIDGTTPSATNYKGKFWTSHDVSIPAGKTVKAIAVRTCFSDSDVATAKT